MQFELVVETAFGREVAKAKANENNLAYVIKRLCAHPRANCLMVNGRGYFNQREALAPLIEVNRYSMANNGARVFKGV